jgi:hypothetical protein
MTVICSVGRQPNGFQDNRLIRSVGMKRGEEFVMLAATHSTGHPRCGGQSRMPPLTILQAFLVPTLFGFAHVSWG